VLSTEYDKTGAAETLHVAVSWNGETLLVQSCTRSAEGAVSGLYQCFDALMRGIAEAVIERRLEEEENGGSPEEPPIFKN
jgi:hypothetical protein